MEVKIPVSSDTDTSSTTSEEEKETIENHPGYDRFPNVTKLEESQIIRSAPDSYHCITSSLLQALYTHRVNLTGYGLLGYYGYFSQKLAQNALVEKKYGHNTPDIPEGATEEMHTILCKKFNTDAITEDEKKILSGLQKKAQPKKESSELNALIQTVNSEKKPAKMEEKRPDGDTGESNLTQYPYYTAQGFSDPSRIIMKALKSNTGITVPLIVELCQCCPDLTVTGLFKLYGYTRALARTLLLKKRHGIKKQYRPDWIQSIDALLNVNFKDVNTLKGRDQLLLSDFPVKRVKEKEQQTRVLHITETGTMNQREIAVKVTLKGAASDIAQLDVHHIQTLIQALDASSKKDSTSPYNAQKTVVDGKYIIRRTGLGISIEVTPDNTQTAEDIVNTVREKVLRSLEVNQAFELAQDIFVKPQGTLSIGEDTHTTPQDVIDTLITQRFLSPKNNRSRSMLILGDSGMGKTTLMKEVTRRLWNTYEQTDPTRRADRWLPLFIQLSTIPTRYLTDGLLTHYLTHINYLHLSEADMEQLKEKQLLLVLDGYDEIHKKLETGGDHADDRHRRINLIQSNRWLANDWNIKVITTCRPEVLVNQTNYRTLFSAGSQYGALMDITLAPFKQTQIKQYVQQYVAKRLEQTNKHTDDTDFTWDQSFPYWPECDAYTEHLNRYDTLKALTQTPYVLAMIMLVLPKMTAEAQKDIDTNKDKQKKHTTQHVLTRAKIYDYFIDQWFRYQATRLEQLGLPLHAIRTDIPHEKDEEITPEKSYLYTYAENLAFQQLQTMGRLEIDIDENATLHHSLLEVRDKKRFKGYETDREYFEDKDNKTSVDTILVALRSGCLLKTAHGVQQAQSTTHHSPTKNNSGGTFSFMHKSLIEYFAARELFQGLWDSADHYIESLTASEETQESAKADARNLLTFNEKLLVSEPGIMQFLGDRLKEYPHFEHVLFKLIHLSKDEENIHIAAANAISVLNRAGYAFADQDFKNINIQGADLSGAWLAGTDFTKAHVEGVNFSQAYLKDTNFKKAHVNNINLGQWPYLEEDALITGCGFTADGKWLVTGDNQGYLKYYNTDTTYPTRMARQLALAPLTRQIPYADTLIITP